MKKIKKLFTLISLIGLTVFALFYFGSLDLNSIISNEIITAEENIIKNSSNDVLAERKANNGDFEKKVKKSKNRVETILLVGVDTPDIKKMKVKENGATGFRTDTIMIAHIDQDENKVDVISIPRDSLVYINGKQDKINHAHSFGGIDLLIETIENNFNIEIDKYVRADYKIVEEITKDIGGVDVVITEEMKYVDPTPELGIDINFTPGRYNLQGKDAVRFLRYRSKEGDIYRVKNQQYFVKQFINKVYDVGVIKSSKIVFENSLKYVDTNLSTLDIFGLINIGTKINEDMIDFHIIDGYGKYINGISYYIVNDFEEINKIINNKTTTEEEY